MKILNIFADFGVQVKVPLIHPGQFQWEEPQSLIAGVKGDQPLVSRYPTNPIEIPRVVRNLSDFIAFADERHISLTNINIDDLIEEMEVRGRILAGMRTVAYKIPGWIKLSVRCGEPRELIALMTLSLFLFGNNEFAFLFIFCICKLSAKHIRKIMKSIFDKTYNS